MQAPVFPPSPRRNVWAECSVLMIRGQVFDQVQDRVTSDMESAKDIYNNYLERLKDSLRIQATRMIIYGASTFFAVNRLPYERIGFC
jgi:hypothetical protein